MSILSDALLENLMAQGTPILIVPESSFVKKKKTRQELFNDSFKDRIMSPKLEQTSIIPSPKPG